MQSLSTTQTKTEEVTARAKRKQTVKIQTIQQTAKHQKKRRKTHQTREILKTAHLKDMKRGAKAVPQVEQERMASQK